MKRLFGNYAYSEGPRAGCWWDQTCEMPTRAPISATGNTDVAVIGAGFTGLSAALHLAQAGVSVTVLEAQSVGWGASGRNGGFCCLGGGMLEDAALDRRVGRVGRIAYRRTELAAIGLVDKLLSAHGIDVDRHSDGEVSLAHRPADMDDLRAKAAVIDENYGVAHTLFEQSELAGHGMAGPFHGALSIAAGFGLNPRKYVAGLARAAVAAGAAIHERSAVQAVSRQGDGWHLRVNGHGLRADQVIIATNGYSSDDLPQWLSGRYLPSQSNVIVSRPLSEDERAAAGWTSDMMVYDTRNLIHYFRLMPDGRFLFGMRGGVFSSPQAEARARRRVRTDFEAMFPAWRDIETPHSWSGMVSLARDQMPFIGAVPGQPGLWAGLCYHGNGVAMGSYSGALLAQLIQGKTPDIPYPQAIRAPLRRFELGPLRRAIIPFAYAGFAIADR